MITYGEMGDISPEEEARWAKLSALIMKEIMRQIENKEEIDWDKAFEKGCKEYDEQKI